MDQTLASVIKEGNATRKAERNAKRKAEQEAEQEAEQTTLENESQAANTRCVKQPSPRHKRGDSETKSELVTDFDSTLQLRHKLRHKRALTRRAGPARGEPQV